MSVKSVLKMMKEHTVTFIDFRFTDTRGKEQHVTVPASHINDDSFAEGKMFDGSSIPGWQGIDASDMILMPDTESAILDPFTEEPTLNIRCDVLEPDTMQAYERDPRSVAHRAEAYMQSLKIADAACFGTKAQFFVFDDVRWSTETGSTYFYIDSDEAAWNTRKEYTDGNAGHRPRVKGGNFPVPPVDSLHDIRNEMCLAMEQMGITAEAHNHAAGTAGQCEIGTRFNTLVKRADEVQIMKYVIHNVAHLHGKTATFMPRPLVGDTGSGMHVHMSLNKKGKNLFSGDEYGGLSELALHYIGGVIKHARAVNAFSNASTNSYKRLVPCCEAPVMLAYSTRNRSASVRIPQVTSPRAHRIEARFPDSSGNPYLTLTALLMAGLDGIKNRTHPGEAVDTNFYTQPAEEAKKIPTVAQSLDQALSALDTDREFLTAGGVMSDAMIDAYISLKTVEVTRLRMATHPIEFDQYYSL